MDANTTSDIILQILQVIGTIAFAISGALVAGRREMDWFGVVVLAVVVAVGGGSLRDLLLGITPVFWVQTPWYVFLAAVTALAIIPLARLHYPHRHALMLSDAIGLSVFAVLGTQKALAVGAGASVAVAMGVITGVFGGILRDVLASKEPSILYGEIYALAALAGCAVFVVLRQTSIQPLFVLWLSIGIVLALRLIGILGRWSLPTLGVDHDA